MNKVTIGLDIGGTKIRAGRVNEAGRVCGNAYTIPTCAHEPRERIVENLLALLHQVMEQAEDEVIQGIGVGCTGPLDNEKGLILEVANLPTLNFYPLKTRLEQEFALKVVMDNDANVLILGEAIYGAGHGAQSVLGLTLGTGLGCAFVVDGKIRQGHTGCAGEIWTSPYKEGIMEDYVSGNAITRCYQKQTGRMLPAFQIAELAREGDILSQQVWNQFAKDLAYALAWVTNMTDPERIVMGGSLVKSADLFWEQTDSLFRSYLCQPIADSIRLKPSMLGEDAGVIGAAALI